MEEIKAFKNRFKLSLNSQQEIALEKTKGQTLLLAVPGSGKTNVIICRIAYLLFVEKIQPQSILALTFSRMGARDLKQRYEALFKKEGSEDLHFTTIHSFALKVIRFYERRFQRQAFSILGSNVLMIRGLYRDLFQAYPGEIELGEIVQQIGYCKNRMLTQKEILSLFPMDIDFMKIFQAYEVYKQKQHLMDFDDILKYAWVLLKKYPEILSYFREKYTHIHLDEAQDTSKIQFKFLELLAGEKGNFFIVGDEDQSIYGFRGASPELLLTFKETWPQAEILFMETNYRSTEKIVSKANAFIKHNKQRYVKEMVSVKEMGMPIIREWVKSAEAQYDLILEAIKKEGKEIAVLYRNNESVIPLVDLFEREKISYEIKEHNPLFFSHYLIKDLKFFYKFACDPTDYKSFCQIAYKMDLAISRESLENLEKELKEGDLVLETLLKKMGETSWQTKRLKAIKFGLTRLKNAAPEKGISWILEDLGYAAYLNFRINSGQSEESIEQKLMVLKILGKRSQSFEDFFENLNHLEARLREENPNKIKKPQVTLSTIHSSKGLEFEKVFMIDVIEGQLPSTVSLKEGNESLYAEEVRLFYVGITRAKKELVFIHIKGGAKLWKPSRFIDYFMNGLPKEGTLIQSTIKKPRGTFRQERKKTSPNLSDYEKGAHISHDHFGKGRILDIKGELAEVEFEKGGIKKMNLGVCLENEVLKRL